MSTIFLAFIVFIIVIGAVSFALMWHWKKYMPETGRGVSVFTIYMIGLAILLMALFTTITNIS